ncbi:MAG: glycosyltransferase family 2 protein, partial [Saprospiraceae bacterium]
MKISGFTFMRNTSSLYYPFLESIQSILPIVDEFVIAIGDNAPGDQTENLLQTLQSDKIKLIHTIWDLEKFKKGTVYA